MGDLGTPHGVWAVVMLVLVGSSVIAMRLSMAQWLRYGLGWLAIFGGLYGVMLFRGELSVVWDRARADVMGEAPAAVGSVVEIPVSDDGHYWAMVSINGVSERFLIDSGASGTVIGSGLAQRMGLTPTGSFPVVLDTANGSLRTFRARADTMTVAGIQSRDVPLLISERDDDISVVGMSWLSRLKSWRVEGNRMILDPGNADGE